jgi:hypothetical protein
MQAAGLKDKLLRSHAEMTNLADRHRKEKENLQNYAVQVRITLLGDTLPAFERRIHARLLSLWASYCCHGAELPRQQGQGGCPGRHATGGTATVTTMIWEGVQSIFEPLSVTEAANRVAGWVKVAKWEELAL